MKLEKWQTRRNSLTALQPAPVPSRLQRKCACSGSSASGECEECKKKKLQWKAIHDGGPAVAPPIVHDVLGSPGQPLDHASRSFFEPHFGHDFSKVRVHTDDTAAKSAEAVNALAFTIGHDVVFNSGMYAPVTAAGRQLLAHELTHVVQQESRNLSSTLQVGPAYEEHERAADLAGEAVRAGDGLSSQGPRIGASSHFWSASLHPASAQLMREPKPLSPELRERVNRVEKLIQKNWGKYIEKAKLKSPLREKIIWYDNDKELYVAKFTCAGQLAQRDVNKLSAKEKKELIKKYKSLTLKDDPTFADIRQYAVGALQHDYFLGLGGDEVPAFFCQTDQKIYLTGDKVGRIAHEAFHYYGSPEFRNALGRDLDEGMAQFLAEQIEEDYSAEYSREGGLPLEITAYGENVKSVQELLKKGALKKDKVIESYFTGGKEILRHIKKTQEEFSGQPTKSTTEAPAVTPREKKTVPEPEKH